MIKQLSDEDIPQFLDGKYRECADEDGAIQKYKVVTDKDSYREGYRKAEQEIKRKVMEAIGDELWKTRKMLNYNGKPTLLESECCSSILSITSPRWSELQQELKAEVIKDE